MRIDIYDKTAKKVYSVPVGDSSTYTWKLMQEEYITIVFTTVTLLKLKKGYYCDIGDDNDTTQAGALGRFEIVTLPSPTASSKGNGYDYELRMDRPWAKWKNRIMFMSRGSVLGMESKWSLTDTIKNQCSLLTDNLTKCGFTYKGSAYHVAIHDGVDTEKSEVIEYDSTSIYDALTKIADAFDTEWWIEKDVIHFGRCEQGDTETELAMFKQIASLSRSEDSEKHGTRLYAFGSSRNLNQNYRRKLKNPFTVNGWQKLYEPTFKITLNEPAEGGRYSKTQLIEFKEGALKGQRLPFKLVSGYYALEDTNERWDSPVFEITTSETIEVTAGTKVQLIIGDATATQTDVSITTIKSVERGTFYGFSFKDLKLPDKAVTSRTTLTLSDGTAEKHIAFIGVVETADGKSTLNEGRDIYKFSDGAAPTKQEEQKATLAHPSMMYVNKLYTEPTDGQSELAIQGIADNVLQLPTGTPYIDSDGMDDDDQITEITEQNEDIYPRCLLTLTEVTTVDAKTTDEDTGNVEYWKAYRFKAKKQDGTPFEFDDSYIIQDEDKPLSIHFESGKLSGLEFEVHFNPDGKSHEKQLFEITRNETYTLELPNETTCPQVGDTLYMFNMDADIIDDQLISAAETELKEWAEKEMKKLCRDAGTYRATNNAVEWGREKLGVLKKGQKVKLNAPHLVQTSDGTRSSRIIGWDLKLEDMTQGEYSIGESKAYSNSENLSNDVQELVYYNGQIKDGSGGVSIQLYDKLITQLQSRVEFLGKQLNDKLSRVAEDTAQMLINFAQGLTAGDFVGGKFGKGAKIDQNGDAELNSLTVREFIETPEFRYNRISINIGNQWRAPGGGIIERVVPDTDSNGNQLTTGTLYLHLEDGEIGTIANDDICQGIYHDGMTLNNNATDYIDDGIGNFAFPGFYTCYFRITEITETKTNRIAKYALRPVSDNYKKQMHPRAAMKFVAYGNFTDKTRQKSRYSTRSYERYLTDVDTWEFQEKNVAAQFGDLSNLTLFGLNMKGYSAYLNNIYMTGVIEQLLQQPVRVETTDSLSGFMGYGDTDTLSSVVYRGWIDITSTVKKWKIERDSGDSADDAVWNAGTKAKNFDGTIDIEWNDTTNDLGDNSDIPTVFSISVEGNDGETMAKSETTI